MSESIFDLAYNKGKKNGRQQAEKEAHAAYEDGHRDGHKDGYWAAEQHILSWLRHFSEENPGGVLPTDAIKGIKSALHRPVKVICNETNNSPKDTAAGNVNVDIVAMNPNAVPLVKCSVDDCQELASYSVKRHDEPVSTNYCEKHYEPKPPNWICSHEGCLAPSGYGVMDEHDNKTKPLCAKHAFPNDTGKRL